MERCLLWVSVVLARCCLSLLGLIGCAAMPSPRTPVVTSCSLKAVDQVTIEGVEPWEVAPLAVLDGTLDDPPRTERIAKVAAEQLQARGYPWARIEVERIRHCGIEIHAKVQRGPKFKIARIEFDSDDALPLAERLAAVEDALGTVNAVGGAYVATRMQLALDALVHRYHDMGWIEAQIDPPIAVYDEGRGDVAVKIAIHAGQRFKIRNVVAIGGVPATRAAVIDALGFYGGEWYDATALHEGIARARREIDHKIQMNLQVARENRTVDVEAVVEASP
jgi:outer membrane protein assembly factor BamA